PGRGHARAQGARHDRQDLGAGPAQPPGEEGAGVRPGDRGCTGHGAGDRLPADAAHLRRDRPRGTDPLTGTGARPLHHRPPRDGGRDRLPSRGDAGERVGVAGEIPRQRDRHVRRARLHERALPGALLQGRGGRARAGARGRPRAGEGGGAGRALRVPALALAARPAPTPEAGRVPAGEDAAVHLQAAARCPVAGAPRRGARLMPTIEEIVEGHGICICAGSGGVGKTTTSAALAAGLAARGQKVCVLTIDPAKRLADSLGLKELENTPSRVDPKLFERAVVAMKGALWAMMPDAKATFDDLVRKHAPDAETRDRILENRIYRQLSNALAGSQEYMAMEKLFEIHQEGRYDFLVLDTPP